MMQPLLAESGLLQQMEQNMTKEDGSVYSVYGDSAYPIRAQILMPFLGADLTPEQQLLNKEMSQVRVTVEWMFGRITNLFSYLDLKKNQKILLQPVAKTYMVAVILTNCHACFYGNQVSRFFDIQPPSVEVYLQVNH